MIRPHENGVEAFARRQDKSTIPGEEKSAAERHKRHYSYCPCVSWLLPISPVLLSRRSGGSCDTLQTEAIFDKLGTDLRQLEKAQKAGAIKALN